MSVERVVAPAIADERTTLTGFLDFQRATLERKCDGLTGGQLRERAVPPSQLSLLGIVRHMAEVERNWFRPVLEARRWPRSSGRPLDWQRTWRDLEHASTEESFAVWHAECARSRQLVAAAPALEVTGWRRGEQVSSRDIQRWMAWLLDRYSSAYASNQYRALQQFFKWLAAEDQLPDPMAGLRPPYVTDKLVPVFTSQELTRLEQACAGRSFTQRRDTAVIAVFTATGIRLSELAGLRYDPGDPRRSDIDLWQREITVRGKSGKPRIVKIGHQAARSLDRYLRARARHAQAWRPQLWLGVNNREPLTAAGIYQMTARRGRQCGVDAFPHRFRHHFSHTWLDRGGPEGDLMELNGWASPQMLRRYGASARSARARRTYDRIMTDT